MNYKFPGEWAITPTKMPYHNAQGLVQAGGFTFTKCTITGNNVLMSGGPEGQMQNQTIQLAR